MQVVNKDNSNRLPINDLNLDTKKYIYNCKLPTISVETKHIIGSVQIIPFSIVVIDICGSP